MDIPRRHIFTRQELMGLPREALVDIILALQEQVLRLEERVAQLETRLAQNSHNSHRPPSSDDPMKPVPKSLRHRSDRPSGGQPGHPGQTLKMIARPDSTVNRPLNICPHGHDLTRLPVLGLDKRQAFDLPILGLEVTEHQAEVKFCPSCRQIVTAPFPPGMGASAQYGPRFQALLVYWRHQQLLPLDRIRQMTEDLLGQSISEDTIQNAIDTTTAQLEPFQTHLVDALKKSPQIHVDETGLRVQSQPYWLHVASTPRLTWYGVHPKRGSDAIEDFSILPGYLGRLVHDGLKSYWDYGKDHALCNAHHLRELTFLFEEEGQPWARRLYDFLLTLHRRLARRKQQGRWLSSTAQNRWRRKYRSLLAHARPPPLPHASKNSSAQSKGQNLRDRLKKHESSVLAFLRDPNIPFTNNQAEQDLRMMKVQQKISGGFRTSRGAAQFAMVRSYLSTTRKQGALVWEALTQAIRGKPLMPFLT